MAPFDRPYTTDFLSVSIALCCTILSYKVIAYTAAVYVTSQVAYTAHGMLLMLVVQYYSTYSALYRLVGRLGFTSKG